MTEPREAAPNPSLQASTSAHPSAAALGRMAPTILAALVILGLLSSVNALLADPKMPLGAVVRLGLFSLAGWVAARLLRAAAAGLELFQAHVEATERLAATADRLAGATGREPASARSSPSPPAPPASAVATDPRPTTIAEIRVAIRQGRWDQAEALIQAFADSHPDDRAAAGLAEDLTAAKRSAAEALRVRIDAAREANEPGLILEIHQALAPLLSPEALRELDRGLARWFMGQVQKRLRDGLISIDVVTLASRVADTFDTTPEGASLRAALPTLRRSVGLCARCGQPYKGIDDACPHCLAATTPHANLATSTPPPSDDGPARPPGSAFDDEFPSQPS